MKRLRKGKGKVTQDPLLEDEDAAELRGDDDDDVHDRVPSRRKPARNVAGRHDAGWACFESNITASLLWNTS